jgi:MFS family permease
MTARRMPASGWSGDRFGGRRVLFGATSAFTATSALCAAAGMMAPVGMAMMLACY